MQRRKSQSGPYDPQPLTEIVSKLRDTRQRAGKTLADISAVTGIAPAALCRLEKGVYRNPRYATLARLAAALGGSLVMDFTLP